METYQDIKCFIVDMDGTFYLGESLLPGAREFTEAVRKTGRHFFFFTNNSSHSEEECLEKLRRLGYDEPGMSVIISSHVTIDFLQRCRPGKSVYLLGNENLTNDFRKAGITLTDEDPDIVVLGFDTTLTYEKINKAAHYLKAGKEYIATHPDDNCPLKGDFMLDTGSMMAMFKQVFSVRMKSVCVNLNFSGPTSLAPTALACSMPSSVRGLSFSTDGSRSACLSTKTTFSSQRTLLNTLPMSAKPFVSGTTSTGSPSTQGTAGSSSSEEAGRVTLLDEGKAASSEETGTVAEDSIVCDDAGTVDEAGTAESEEDTVAFSSGAAEAESSEQADRAIAAARVNVMPKNFFMEISLAVLFSKSIYLPFRNK